MDDLGTMAPVPLRGGLLSLSDFGPKELIAPGVEDFSLCLTLVHWPRCPFVEVFGLCLTLDLRNHCPWHGGL